MDNRYTDNAIQLLFPKAEDLGSEHRNRIIVA